MAKDSPIGRRDPCRRGRKRDDDRTQAIVRAAGELLFEVGIDKFRVQDVAERAGAGTGAIYRRWASKEALIAEAMRDMPSADALDTGDPEADLRETIARRFAVLDEQPELLPTMIGVMRTDPAVAAEAHESYAVEPIRAALARVIGDDHPHFALLSELAPALAIHRATLGKQYYGDRSVVDDVMALIDIVCSRDAASGASSPDVDP